MAWSPVDSAKLKIPIILYAVIESFKALEAEGTLTLEVYLRFYHSPVASWTDLSVAPPRQPQGSSFLFHEMPKSLLNVARAMKDQLVFLLASSGLQYAVPHS